VFESPSAALEAAAQIQRELAAEEWPGGRRVRLRIGVHTGEATHTREGYVGIGVHVAGRVGDLGHGGQIVVSPSTAAIARESLPAGTALRELGPVALPGIDATLVVSQLDLDGLPTEFPPLAPVDPEARGLLEREAEVATIDAALAEALEGSGRLVLLEGGAGLGKTGLLLVVRERAEASGLRVLSARGSELEREFAYGIVRQLFESELRLASTAERDELLSGAASLALPLFDEQRLAEVLAEGADTSFSTLHGLYWLAANVAGRAPLALVVDDLHWADGPSLRWLAYLARRLEGLPLVVLAGLRPSADPTDGSVLAELLADPLAMHVRLQTLSLPAASALVHNEYGIRADDAFVAECHRVTGGNPLFLRSLVQTLEQSSVPPTQASVPRVRELGSEAVGRAVALRLARLPASASALARALSVLGAGADVADVRAVAAIEEARVGPGLAALVAVELLDPGLPLRFVHPVVGAAIYDAIPPAERAPAHAAAARVLRERGAEVERVAAHVLRVDPAGDQETVAVLREAASRALAAGAPDVSANYLRRALSEPPADDIVGEVLAGLGSAERRIYGPRAVEHLRAAVERLVDPARRTRTALELGWTLMFTQRPAEGVRVFEHALELDPPAEMRPWLEAAIVDASYAEPTLFPRVAPRLAELAAAPPDPSLPGRVLAGCVAYQAAREGVDRKLAVERARFALEGMFLSDASVSAYLVSGVALTAADEFDQAEHAWARAVETARTSGSAFLFAVATCFRAYTAYRRGDLLAAEADGRASIEAALSNGLDAAVPAAILADVLRERGDVEGAAGALAQTPFGEEIPDTNHLHFLLYTRGRVRLVQGRVDEGIADLLELGRRYESLGGRNPAIFSWRSIVALAVHRKGDIAEARRLADEELELARAWGTPRAVGRALVAAGLVRAELELLEEAVAVLDASPSTVERAHAQLALGAALRRANRRSDAREPLRLARDLAHRVGALPIVERAGEELAATGASPRTLAVAGAASLTASERRVAEMAASGMTNREIAQALFVTPKTVEVHLSSTYRKLAIGSRAQLAGALADD
jgi:DNA-binding CsgD family transcriptional regulator/tetratricopeptide (TPR) repeat protein